LLEYLSQVATATLTVAFRDLLEREEPPEPTSSHNTKDFLDWVFIGWDQPHSFDFAMCYTKHSPY
jgi:hypothetical protein